MKKLLLFITGLFLSVLLSAQTGSIRGFVYEEKTGEPVIFTNVYLQGTIYGASTDVNGYFLISRVPVGDYLLMVTYLGYDTLKMDVSIVADDIISKQLYLKEAVVNLKTVNISAERIEARTETGTSVVKITPKQINQIPAIGGQPDLAQYLQVLPGVVFTGDQGGELYIRGGSPIQNKVLLDGMTIYKAFHSIGLFSVFETDIIRNADIYTGGFGAEYGGRISSIMDITTRDGNRQRIAGKVAASTFGANFLLEGPIQKASKSKRGGSSTFILSVKNSYLEQTSQALYQYVDTNGLPFNYLDIYGKISLQSANGSKVNFYGFHYEDRVNEYRSISNFNWKSSGGGTNFLIIPGKSPVLLEGHIAYSNFQMALEETVGMEISPERTSSINGFDMGLDFTYFFRRNELKYGLQVLGFTTDYYFQNSTGKVIQQKENTTELAFYAKYKAIVGKFIIEPSFRLQWYASLSEISPEPRLALKYNATDRLRFKFAGGLYSQNLISARSDRDVVNLFYGFLSGPDNLPEEFDGQEITSKLQKASHLILGTEIEVTSKILVNIEGYYKYFSQLTNLNRNKIFDENDAPDEPDLLKKDYIIEKGDAYGLDLTLKYSLNRISFWGVYSYAVVNRYYEDVNGELQHYHPHFDRRHNINLLASWIFGGKADWEISARWNFGTGFPFTQTQGYHEKIEFDDIYSNYPKQNGSLGILYGELNQGRLTDYHRLDINLKKRFVFNANSSLEIDVSVTNLYNRENIFYVDRITQEVVYQLPILPSLGVTWRF